MCNEGLGIQANKKVGILRTPDKSSRFANFEAILLLISSWNDGESRQSRENAKQKYLAAACKLQVLDSKRDKMPASIKMIFDRTARASGP